MNQNNKNKVRDFFRKEGFYFILFLCLCVIATTVAITTNKNNAVKKADTGKKEFSLKVEDSNVSDNINKQNAERVENNTTNETTANNTAKEEATTKEEVASNQETAQVSSTITEVKMSLPLDSALARTFGKMVRTKESKGDTVDVTRRGVDLKASEGDVVKAAAEGQVIEVASNPEDGCYIVIAHANGLKTIYTNLAKEVNVATGDKVTEGQEIAKVGNTSTKYTEKNCGTVLNIQVEDSNGKQLNPQDYFTFQ